MPQYADNREDVIAAAKEQGLEVWLSDRNTLQVDCDTFEALVNCHKMYHNYRHSMVLLSSRVTLSKSGAWHVHITTSPRDSVPARIALQAVFGSDPNREALNLRDWEENPEHVPFLIEVPGQTMYELDGNYITVQETRLAMERMRGNPFPVKELLEVEKRIRENL